MKTIAIVSLLMASFAATNAGTQDQLEACRRQIDSIDQQLVKLIQERAELVERVGAIKLDAHMPETDTGREERVIQKVEALAKDGPLPGGAVGRIYEKLVEEMRNWEIDLNSSKPDSVDPDKR